MSITDKPYRVRNCSRHEDPDNSGQCIHCGGITYPDAEDWATQPEICIGDRPTTTNDEQGYYSKGIDPDGIIASAIKRKEAEDPRLQKGDEYFPMSTPAELQTTDGNGGTTIFLDELKDDAWYDFFGIGMRGRDIKVMVAEANDLPEDYLKKQ